MTDRPLTALAVWNVNGDVLLDVGGVSVTVTQQEVDALHLRADARNDAEHEAAQRGLAKLRALLPPRR